MAEKVQNVALTHLRGKQTSEEVERRRAQKQREEQKAREQQDREQRKAEIEAQKQALSDIEKREKDVDITVGYFSTSGGTTRLTKAYGTESASARRERIREAEKQQEFALAKQLTAEAKAKGATIKGPIYTTRPSGQTQGQLSAMATFEYPSPEGYSYVNPDYNKYFGTKRIGDIVSEEVAKGEKGLYRSRKVYENEAIRDYLAGFSSTKEQGDYDFYVPMKKYLQVQGPPAPLEFQGPPEPVKPLKYQSQTEIKDDFLSGFIAPFENIAKTYYYTFGDVFGFDRSARVRTPYLKPELESEYFTTFLQSIDVERLYRNKPGGQFSRGLVETSKRVAEKPKYYAGSAAGSLAAYLGPYGIYKLTQLPQVRSFFGFSTAKAPSGTAGFMPEYTGYKPSGFKNISIPLGTGEVKLPGFTNVSVDLGTGIGRYFGGTSLGKTPPGPKPPSYRESGGKQTAVAIEKEAARQWKNIVEYLGEGKVLSAEAAPQKTFQNVTIDLGEGTGQVVNLSKPLPAFKPVFAGQETKRFTNTLGLGGYTGAERVGRRRSIYDDAELLYNYQRISLPEPQKEKEYTDQVTKMQERLALDTGLRFRGGTTTRFDYDRLVKETQKLLQDSIMARSLKQTTELKLADAQVQTTAFAPVPSLLRFRFDLPTTTKPRRIPPPEIYIPGFGGDDDKKKKKRKGKRIQKKTKVRDLVELAFGKDFAKDFNKRFGLKKRESYYA